MTTLSNNNMLGHGPTSKHSTRHEKKQKRQLAGERMSGSSPSVATQLKKQPPKSALKTSSSSSRQPSRPPQEAKTLDPDLFPSYWTEEPGTLQSLILKLTKPKNANIYAKLVKDFGVTFERLNVQFHKLSVLDTGAGGDCLFSSVWEAYKTIAPSNRRHLSMHEGVVWLRKMTTAFSIREYLKISSETFATAKEAAEAEDKGETKGESKAETKGESKRKAKSKRAAAAAVEEADVDLDPAGHRATRLRAFELGSSAAFMRQIEASIRSGVRDLTLAIAGADPTEAQQIADRPTGLPENQNPQETRRLLAAQTQALDIELQTSHTEQIDAYSHSPNVAYIELVVPYLRGRMGGIQEASGHTAAFQTREQVLLDPDGSHRLPLEEYEQWFVRGLLQNQFAQIEGGRTGAAGARGPVTQGFPSVFGEAWTISALSAVLGLNIYVLQVIDNQPESLNRSEYFPQGGLYDASRPVLYLINTGQSHFQLIRMSFTPAAANLVLGGLTHSAHVYGLFCRSFSPQDSNLSGGLLLQQHELLAHSIGLATQSLARTPTPSVEEKMLQELAPETVSQLTDDERKLLDTWRSNQNLGRGASVRPGQLDMPTIVALIELRNVLDPIASASQEESSELDMTLAESTVIARISKLLESMGADSAQLAMWLALQDLLEPLRNKLKVRNLWRIAAVWSADLQARRPEMFDDASTAAWIASRTEQPAAATGERASKPKPESKRSTSRTESKRSS